MNYIKEYKAILLEENVDRLFQEAPVQISDVKKKNREPYKPD